MNTFKLYFKYKSFMNTFALCSETTKTQCQMYEILYELILHILQEILYSNVKTYTALHTFLFKTQSPCSMQLQQFFVAHRVMMYT